jgi:hypothetical protein
MKGESLSETARPNSETVRVRVLEKGHDRVSTGLYDERTRIFTKFEAGEEFDIARDIAESLVARGFVEIHKTPPEASYSWSKRARERLASRSERATDTGCLIWQGARTGGYGNTAFLGKTYPTHRLAWLAHHGPIPDGLLVCHRCDNRLCIEPDHLFLGTPQQNVVDMIRKGRGRLRGGRLRLEASQVAIIKRRLLHGESIASLAEELKVADSTISDIKRGKTWTFIEPG